MIHIPTDNATGMTEYPVIQEITMNSEIERVARALIAAHDARQSNSTRKALPGYNAGSYSTAYWDALAEAAIAAMSLQSLLAQAQEADERLREAVEIVLDQMSEASEIETDDWQSILRAALQPNAGEGLSDPTKRMEQILGAQFVERREHDANENPYRRRRPSNV